MTGLDPTSDTIMSISCIITNSDLLPLDAAGFNAVIHHTADQLSSMSEWCVNTHGASGLTQSCLSSSTTAAAASAALLAYVKHHVPEPRRALLAGNSIHADRSFLSVAPWNAILEHLHYRLFDVSAMKEMVRRWASDEVLMNAPRKELKHTAHDDVLESLQEARYYKGLIEAMVSGPLGPSNPSQHTAVDAAQNGQIPNPILNSSRGGFGAGGMGAGGERPVLTNGSFPLSSIPALVPPNEALPASLSQSTTARSSKPGHEADSDLDFDPNIHDEGYRTDVP